MKKVKELVYSVQGIEDLAAILHVSFEEAFQISQRIRNEQKRENTQISQEHHQGDATSDTIIDCDLDDVRKMLKEDIEFP